MTEPYRATLLTPQQAHPAIQQAWMYAKAMIQGGHRLVLTIQPEGRSSQQNRRYWSKGVLFQIAEQAQLGGRYYSSEVWHEFLKKKFIGVMELPDGSVVGMSSTKLTRAEFSDFCTQVEAWAATQMDVHFDSLEES